MADGRDALIARLARLLERGMTKAGHLAQIVHQEHRGNCTVQGCTPACLEAQELRRIVQPYLTTQPCVRPRRRLVTRGAS